MNTDWLRIVSWHAVRFGPQTKCGRVAKPDAETRDTLPAGRTCESCLRIVARENDRT